jgi:transposase
MSIVGGLDVHRRQITFDWVDTRSGDTDRGVIRPATRSELRVWAARFAGKDASFALEGTTGWRFVVEELRAAGIDAHVAEPAETRALRGRKRRAKTDRADARHLRDLLLAGRVPESWVPPAHIADLRTQVRLRRVLDVQRTGWVRRIHAQLFQHGLPEPPDLRTCEGREWLVRCDLPAAARQVIDIGLRMIDVLDAEEDELERQLRSVARRQRGCVALQEDYGIGPLTAVALVAELGDTRRFSSSRKAVRFAGMDVTIAESDGRRSSRGHLSRQGSPILRWALYEAAASAWKTGSPHHEAYVATKARLGTKRARLTVARKMLRRAHHVLCGLGDQAIAPLPTTACPAPAPPPTIAASSRLASSTSPGPTLSRTSGRSHPRQRNSRSPVMSPAPSRAPR